MYSDQEIRKAANRAIKNILLEGLTDVDLFKRPFEIDFLKNQTTKKKIIDKVCSAIKSGEIKQSNISMYGKVLVPKSKVSDFRTCALVDVYDEIYYLTLVLLMGSAIEETRIIPSKKKVFSYRYIKKNNSDRLFDSDYSYSSFRNEVRKKEKMSRYNIVVECDISNFYDRLNLHRLENTLLNITKTHDDVVQLLNDLLLHWSNRDSYGLPVGSNASRILAEALLSDVDKYLDDNKIQFCRFVDDYRIFANNATEAYHHLSLLINRLQLEGLFINSNKTNLRDVSHNTVTKLNSEAEKENDNRIVQENESRKELSKIIRGYSGLVPLKFRKLSTAEVSRLSALNITECYEELESELLIEPKKLRELLKMIVAQNAWEVYKDTFVLLKKFPQFIPYYVDIYLKNEHQVKDSIIEEIRENFINFLKEENLPEYIQIYIIRFFSGDKSFDKEAVLNLFFSLGRDSGDYIGRATLEVLIGKLSRRDLLLLRKYFVRADVWEKRMILYLLNDGLPIEEKNAYFKNISITNTDLFIEHMIDKKRGFMK